MSITIGTSPTTRRSTAAVNQVVVDNADGLYDGLPQLPLRKGKARRQTVRHQPTQEERL